jgi:pimeloyl-ACP methyl ester carboxylesterase
MCEFTYRGRDGWPLFAASLGAGPAVALIHGGGPDHHSLIPLGRRLADQHTVVLPDVRGYGRSVCPDPGRHTWARYADDVAALLDHLGVAAHCPEEDSAAPSPATAGTSVISLADMIDGLVPVWSALARLEPRVQLVDHVYLASPAHHLGAGLVLQRPQRLTHFHDEPPQDEHQVVDNDYRNQYVHVSRVLESRQGPPSSRRPNATS